LDFADEGRVRCVGLFYRLSRSGIMNRPINPVGVKCDHDVVATPQSTGDLIESGFIVLM
jgi:hypothetical protein